MLFLAAAPGVAAWALPVAMMIAAFFDTAGDDRADSVRVVAAGAAQSSAATLVQWALLPQAAAAAV